MVVRQAGLLPSKRAGAAIGSIAKERRLPRQATQNCGIRRKSSGLGPKHQRNAVGIPLFPHSFVNGAPQDCLQIAAPRPRYCAISTLSSLQTRLLLRERRSDREANVSSI